MGNRCINHHCDDNDYAYNPNTLNQLPENSAPVAQNRHLEQDDRQTTNIRRNLEQDTGSTALSNVSTNIVDQKFDVDHLTKNLKFLCENLAAKEVTVFLESTQDITKSEADDIRAEKTPYNENLKLITLVRKRGPKAIEHFRIALEETGQQNVADELYPMQSKKKDIISATQRAQTSLRQLYLQSFKMTNPFSLPFTFDIESTWVSLALREDQCLQMTADHAELLDRAFKKARMLIIEGKPATGKTSLVRRIAFDWAKEVGHLQCYDLVIYTEFRRVNDNSFNNIVDLVICAMKSLFDEETCKLVESLIQDKEFFGNHRVLMLLDGYDELLLENQCNELQKYFNETTFIKPLMFDVILTTRPGYLSLYRGQKGRFIFADVLGFTTKEQKEKYISNHFYEQTKDSPNIEAVRHLLETNDNLNKLAETPLFLTFICLVHEKIVDGTLLELYYQIIWWLLDRHQKDFPNRDIPLLFGFEQKASSDKFQTIQDYYLQFPQLHFLGKMALHNIDKSVFKKSDLVEYKLNSMTEKVGLLRKEEIRDISFCRTTEFSFPHRTIQEFLAANVFVTSLFSRDKLAEEIIEKVFQAGALDSHKALDPHERESNEMSAIQNFIWRIITLRKMAVYHDSSIDSDAGQHEFFNRFTTLTIDMDIFIVEAKISSPFLHYFLSLCSNVATLHLYGSTNFSSLLTQSIDLSQLRKLEYFRFGNSTSPRIEIANNAAQKIIILPKNKISICLQRIVFHSARKFVETLDYFSSFLEEGSSLKLKFVEIRDEEHSFVSPSFFVVTVKEKLLADFIPIKIIPKYFIDQKLNEALRWVSLAKFFRVCERNFGNKSLCLDVFSCLKEVSFWNIPFPENILIKLPNLSKLEFWECTFFGNFRINYMKELQDRKELDNLRIIECKINAAAWQSLTKEFCNKSKIKHLHLSIDIFFGEYSKKLLSFIVKCSSTEQLTINGVCYGRKFEEEDTLEAVEDNFTKILCNLASTMKQLQRIYLQNMVRKMKDYNAELVKNVGLKRTPNFQFEQYCR